MVSIADKPWLKQYDVGGKGLFVLPQSLKPYPKVPLYTVLDNSARDFPDRPAIHFMDKVISYTELKDLTDRFANALFNLGVKKGDRVATFLSNCPQFIISDFGTLKAGGTHVPCSHLHKEEELISEIGGSGAETIVCMDSSIETINKIKDRTSIKRIIITSAGEFSPDAEIPEKILGTYRLHDLLAEYPAQLPKVDINPEEDLAELIFTGGTTGTPKGVMLPHTSRLANLCHMAWAFGPLEQAMRGQCSWLISVPLFHQFGMTLSHFCIYWAFEIYMVPDSRDLKAIYNILKNNEPTACSCVPTQYVKLVEMGLGKLQTFFTSSTAPLPKEVSEKFKEETGAQIGDSYGASEMGAGTHANLSISDLSEVKKVGSIGVPMPDVEIRLVDPETGKDVGPGEEGELWVKGPQIMKGYWPTSGSGLIDGWLPMGDIARMDDDGYFYITDRVKDMANVSGMKVYTILVDRVLYEHPGVELAAAIAVPDKERLGSDRVKAIIKLKPEYVGKVTEEEIVALCKSKLAPYAVPKYVEFRDELPLSGVGKILKRQLREEELKKFNA
ncbi:MAG: AMP-binding protein [Dehalococcoidia bacterium]|nr:AMP-binding protein [Dehalococcoidia bacterium]